MIVRKALRLWPWLGCAVGIILAAQAAWIPVKAQVAQVLLDDAFSRSVETGSPQKPWPWADTIPIARISVERIGVSEVILSGGSGEAMAFGPTAMLDRDPSGVTVLAAHRDTHFRFIRNLRSGDEVTMQRIDGSQIRYRVTGFQTVRWNEFGYPAKAHGQMLAMATCFPFDTDTPGPLRRVAWAEQIA